jgi:hypothetical protein
MPSLGFFADAEDAPLLVEHLNDDPELAFLVPVDPLVLLPQEAARALAPNAPGPPDRLTVDFRSNL